MQTAASRRFPHVPAGGLRAYTVIGERLTFKVMSEATDGAFSVMELSGQPGGGPPMHTHPSAESFTILEGTFDISGLDDGEQFTIRAQVGDSVFVPAGVPHTYSVASESPGKALLVFSPGDEMEAFFAEAGEPVIEGVESVPAPPDIPAMIEIAGRHGMVFIGPGGP